jgi:hypothetical protein
MMGYSGWGRRAKGPLTTSIGFGKREGWEVILAPLTLLDNRELFANTAEKMSTNGETEMKITNALMMLVVIFSVIAQPVFADELTVCFKQPTFPSGIVGSIRESVWSATKSVSKDGVLTIKALVFNDKIFKSHAEAPTGPGESGRSGAVSDDVVRMWDNDLNTAIQGSLQVVITYNGTGAPFELIESIGLTGIRCKAGKTSHQ